MPGCILRIEDDRGTRMAEVDFGGVRKRICLAYLPEAEVGDWTIVHAGFALTLIDEASALETLELFRSLGLLDDELGVLEAIAEVDAVAIADVDAVVEQRSPAGTGGGA